MYGRADFAVSVGERADGKPVAGAILRPADGLWLVTSDQGVYVGRESESARNAVPDIRPVRLADSLITVRLPYSLTARQDTSGRAECHRVTAAVGTGLSSRRFGRG